MAQVIPFISPQEKQRIQELLRTASWIQRARIRRASQREFAKWVEVNGGRPYSPEEIRAEFDPFGLTTTVPSPAATGEASRASATTYRPA
jgi:hypothetical protein